MKKEAGGGMGFRPPRFSFAAVQDSSSRRRSIHGGTGKPLP
jgi:hypothetical protein